jgi:hypothetical protein
MRFLTRPWIFHFFILATTSLPAMQQKPQYHLINAIAPQYAKGKITFVKQFFNGTIIVFDDQCRGELFDSSYKHLCNLWGPEAWCVCNAYKVRDDEGKELIIAQGDDKITVYNLQKSDKDFLFRRCINLNLKNKFSLLQRPDLSLFTRLYPQNIEININPNWHDATTGNCKIGQYSPPIDVSYCHNEGTLVPAIWYKDDHSVWLSNDMFSAPLISPINMSNSITCYHKTLNGIMLVGHIGGFIGIWQSNQKS